MCWRRVIYQPSCVVTQAKNVWEWHCCSLQAAASSSAALFPSCSNSRLVYRLSQFASLPSLRCDVTQGKWVRCNEHMQKACHFPVFGLQEGALYRFRVRAVNKAGAGRPSKATEPVLTADPLEHTRAVGKSSALRLHTCGGYKNITVDSLIGDSFWSM